MGHASEIFQSLPRLGPEAPPPDSELEVLRPQKVYAYARGGKAKVVNTLVPGPSNSRMEFSGYEAPRQASSKRKVMVGAGKVSHEDYVYVRDLGRELVEHLDPKRRIDKLAKEEYFYEGFCEVASFVAQAIKFEGQRRAQAFLLQVGQTPPSESRSCLTRKVYTDKAVTPGHPCTCTECKYHSVNMCISFEMVVNKVKKQDPLKTALRPLMAVLEQYLQQHDWPARATPIQDSPDSNMDLGSDQSGERSGDPTPCADDAPVDFCRSGCLADKRPAPGLQTKGSPGASAGASQAPVTAALDQQIQRDAAVLPTLSRAGSGATDVMDTGDLNISDDEETPEQPQQLTEPAQPRSLEKQSLLRRHKPGKRKLWLDAPGSAAGSARQTAAARPGPPSKRQRTGRATLHLSRPERRPQEERRATGPRRRPPLESGSRGYWGSLQRPHQAVIDCTGDFSDPELAEQMPPSAAESKAPQVDKERKQPDVALVIKKHWCDKIFDGTKVWEIRGTRLSKRGRACIAQSKSQKLVGEVKFIDCLKVGRLTEDGTLKPFSDTEEDRRNFIGAPENLAKHCIEDLSCVQYAKVFAWVMESRQRYAHPVPYKHKVGCITWVRLERAPGHSLAKAAGQARYSSASRSAVVDLRPATDELRPPRQENGPPSPIDDDDSGGEHA